ncbi:TBC1 domain family member 7 [Papilio xuthus]|uniref:TBC1 domain family member 7 n=1 Tax=Papilio xuthus TaxID=66420 RepID=A0A194PLN9_PAPXU|nr:TBC1 domain family member 7 [Papilio xuthus]
MTDERNFRSSYYEKVGCRGVEEKKSLEILMKEKPWDKVKLKQFCLRFMVPASYRNLVWKVLLDIIPVYADSHQFVMEQRKQQYGDLLYAVDMLDLVDMSAPRTEILLAMWLLENEERRPPLFPETNFNVRNCLELIRVLLVISKHERSSWSPLLTITTETIDRDYFSKASNFNLKYSSLFFQSADTFLPIAKTLIELYDNEVDVYWLCKSLTDIVRNMQKDLPKLKEAFQSMLEKEDVELFNHLVDINALDVLPLTKWFNSCFAGVLDVTSLPKIWDKVCSGAPKILSVVAVMLVITLRRNILKAQNGDEVLKCVSEIPEQCEEVVANKAIELWQYGAQPQNDQLAKK